MEIQSGAVKPVECIQKGWDLIKNDYWLFFGMTLLSIFLIIVAGIVLGLINTGITNLIARILGFAVTNAGDAAKISAVIIPQIISLVIGIFLNVFVITLSGALFCGIYSALSRKSNTGVCDFGDLFSGFQKIMPCVIVAIIMSLIQFIYQLIMVFFGAAVGISAVGAGIITKDGQLNPAVFGGLFLALISFVLISIVVNLIISVLTSFTYPLIAERDVSGGQAFLLSVKGGLSNVFGMILLFILMFFMSLGGALLCFIGILFVMPILSASLFIAYQSVFGRVSVGGFQTPPPPPNFGY